MKSLILTFIHIYYWLRKKLVNSSIMKNNSIIDKSFLPLIKFIVCFFKKGKLKKKQTNSRALKKNVIPDDIILLIFISLTMFT